MTTIKKSRHKEITPEIKNGFGLALTELGKSEPAPKRRKDTVTSLIVSHRYQIMDLLSKGFTVEQIVEQLAKINLEISTDIIRSTLRKTDEYGNRIVKAKGKKTVKSVARSSKKPQVETIPEVQAVANKPDVISSAPEKEKPVDAPYRPFVEAQSINAHEEPKKRRGPVTIDDDL
jgi:hypothetical protein